MFCRDSQARDAGDVSQATWIARRTKMMKRILAIAIVAALGMAFALGCLGCSPSSAGNSSAAIVGQWNLYAVSLEDNDLQEYSLGTATVDAQGNISVTVGEQELSGTWTAVSASEWPNFSGNVKGYYDVALRDDSNGKRSNIDGIVSTLDDGNTYLYLIFDSNAGTSLVFWKPAK